MSYTRPTLYTRLTLLLSLAVAALALACGSGDDPEPDATPTPPADAQAIRSVSFAQNAEVQTTLRQIGGGGGIEESEIIYADLTSDRREEAIVPVSSGGTQGNVAYLVFTMRGDTPSLILTRTLERGSAGGLVMKVEDGKLRETSANYGPQDPLCCPSQLKTTVFRWDGSQLQVEREETTSQPAGPKQ